MRISILAAALLVSASASAQSFGSWTVGASDDGAIVSAETRNDSGASFGVVCTVDNGDCFWSLDTQPDCEHGGQYPVMANTDSGAYALTLTCAKSGAAKLLVFSDFDQVDELVVKGSRVGFAIPMKDGQFRVVRFSLIGSNDAIRTARDVVTRVRKSSTKDINL